MYICGRGARIKQSFAASCRLLHGGEGTLEPAEDRALVKTQKAVRVWAVLGNQAINYLLGIVVKTNGIAANRGRVKKLLFSLGQ